MLGERVCERVDNDSCVAGLRTHGSGDNETVGDLDQRRRAFWHDV